MALVVLAQVGEHVVPVQAGQTQVQDQGVVARGPQRTADHAAIGDPVDLVVVLGQRTHQPVGQRRFIFRQQKAHSVLLGGLNDRRSQRLGGNPGTPGKKFFACSVIWSCI
jgi:hypothetical protein